MPQGGRLRWYPFFENAYSGGGFTLGVGHLNYVSAYNMIDVRGSSKLSLLGGWREAMQVGT